MAGMPKLHSPEDRVMWQSLADGDMRLQRCVACASWRYPPGPACPQCLGTESSWELISGRGKVLSWTTFHRQYLPAWPAPHTVVAARLAEGPIIIANIARADVPRLAMDAEIEIYVAEHPDGYRLPSFRLRG